MQRTMSAAKVAGLVGGGPWEPPAYAALAARLRRSTTEGRLPAGTRLPSERDLTGAVGLSRTTVTRAYGLLREQGYLETRRGSGSVVRLPHVPGGRVDHLLAPGGSAEDAIDLSCTASPAPGGVMQAYEQALTELGGYLPGSGYYPSGLPLLREALAERYTRRGLPTDPDQVIVTSGALAGTAVAVQALLSPGDRVVVESPTYPNAIATLTGARARTVPHPVDHRAPGQEWDPEGLALLLRQVGARAAYLVPDFHNPTGALMDAAQREQVAAALTRARTVALVDESPVDLPLDLAPGQMPAPFGAFAPDTVTVGSASKSFWCGLRIGWMRLPRERVEQMATVRLRLDLGAPVLEQLVVAGLLGDSEREAQLHREQVDRLSRGRQLLQDGLAQRLPDWQVNDPPGGLSLWCELPEPRSTALTVAARRHGVLLASGPTFAPAGGMDSWIRLPYALGPESLVDVPERLEAAWAEALTDEVTGAGAERRPVIA
ncbi:MocR-like transcription factor YczR [Ornithinicoccus halotolerans]|uniref:MocR-like transcription factor YczR n=1 Tax=Ornithinicoccus halotolerans TaxID=1748220 RepID=UPI001E3DF22C|nr:PLP-dependent aminotransferase family protein [Ornithinicoccus halotolerans]